MMARTKKTLESSTLTRNNWYEGLDWLHLIFFGSVQISLLILVPFVPLQAKTAIFTVLYGYFTGMGTTAGYHRLWSHRSYHAGPLLRTILAALGAATFQRSIIWWVYHHRSHHRYVDTDRDPYNARRGLLCSHFGWLALRQDIDNRPGIDISDLRSDPIVIWQDDNFPFISFLVGVLLPFLIVGLGWGDWIGGIVYGVLFRISFIWNVTFAVNSFAHWVGDQPFADKHTPRNNHCIALFTLGEGYHNFHHEFPSDYRNGIEWYDFDPTKWAIWLSSKLGLSLGLKRFRATEIEKARVQQAQKKLLSKAARLNWGPPLHKLPVIEWEDYIQQSKKDGKSLVAVAGVVHDVSDFIGTHPGGRAMLKGATGKDATPMFHGGVYDHSNAANILLATMRVSVIRGGGEVEAWKRCQ